MMFWTLRIWSRFIIWLFGGFKGAGNPKDAWFAGSPSFYSGLVVWVGAIPISGKGWILFWGLGAYLFVLFSLLNLELPMFLYVLLGVLGMAAFYRLASPKTFWTTREKLREISSGKVWPRRP
jgi:hypothetical protein